MKNYQEVEQGVYQSIDTVPSRKVDNARIREILRDTTPVKPQSKGSLIPAYRPAEATR